MRLTGKLNPYGGNVVDPTARQAIAETDAHVQDLEDKAVTLNGVFDDTVGWWQQMQGEDKREDAVIVHGREIVQSTGNIEVSPAIITQTLVSYSCDKGENFTRMSNSYHELIGEGEVSAERDSSTPNFTAMGATCYNKFKGNVGMCAVIGRVYDKGYTDEELNGNGANKSCAGGFMAYRHGAYRQGKNGGSYSIGMESYTINVPTDADDTDFYGNDDYFIFKTWTCGYHCGVGGTHPVTAGILINGFSEKTYPSYTSGTYNGIVIGASSMKINGRNSHDTVGLCMANWSKGSKIPVRDENGNLVTDINGDIIYETYDDGTLEYTGHYGFYGMKIGYAPRTIATRGACLIESPGTKFLNPKGDLPAAISANGTPYMDFKTGDDSDYYEDPETKKIPKERPTDTTHARIGYVSANKNLNVSSDGNVRFVTGRDFSDSTKSTVDYTMSGTAFSPSSAVNLGTSSNKWDNIYANTDTITTSDRNFKEDIADIDEKLLRAWSKVDYKIFRFKDGSRKHIGLVAQDIDEAFQSEGLNARDYGLFCEDVDKDGNITLGVRYSECLALECALLRSKIGA